MGRRVAAFSSLASVGAASAVACLALALATGCRVKTQEVPSALDHWTFQHVGGTLFGNPDLLTMKEIHLDNGLLTGREIIIEGDVADVSANGTYLVLKDETARMLVVLTDVEYMQQELKDDAPKSLRILGTVESGKKGLPYLRARAVNAGAKRGAAGSAART
jgi:hypothetical protein